MSSPAHGSGGFPERLVKGATSPKSWSWIRRFAVGEHG